MSIAKGERVTLRGIRRRGLVEWKQRHWWSAQEVLIWSGEHHAWWRPDSSGYTTVLLSAGIYKFADAYDNTKHCGPEKKIEYQTRAYARTAPR